MPFSSLVEVQASTYGTARLIAVKGEVDLSSTRKVGVAIDAALADRPETLVLDLSAISFCDSSGIRLVTATYRRAVGQGVRLAVVRPTGPAWRAFELCHIDREIPFVTAPEDALASAPDVDPDPVG